MKENDKKELENMKDLPEITALELEKMLKRYGMKKSQFCYMFSKTRSWFYSVLRKNKYIPLYVLQAFVEHVGRAMFEELREKVQCISHNEHELKREIDYVDNDIKPF